MRIVKSRDPAALRQLAAQKQKAFDLGFERDEGKRERLAGQLAADTSCAMPPRDECAKSCAARLQR